MNRRITGFLLNVAGIFCVIAGVELYNFPLAGLGTGLCVWAGTFVD